MEKHTAYYALRDALTAEGCALCRLAQQAVQSFMDYLIYERVNDRGVRHDFRQARGFCNLHAWQLHDRGGALSIAILNRDVLQTVSERVRRSGLPDAGQSILGRVRTALGTPAPAAVHLARDLTPQQPCPACQVRQRAESEFAQHLLAHVDDPEVAVPLQDAGGLCLPHLRLTLEHAHDQAAAARLLTLQQAAWEHLLRQLDEFVRKHDYRFRDEELLPGEEDAWVRALARVSGQRGLR